MATNKQMHTRCRQDHMCKAFIWKCLTFPMCPAPYFLKIPVKNPNTTT